MPEVNDVSSEATLKYDHFYRLRININGFLFQDINVTKVMLSSPNNSADLETAVEYQVKVEARRSEKTLNGRKNESDEIDRVYTKVFDVLARNHVDGASMRYYEDPKNPLYLIIEFKAASEENVYHNMDDSCESLVEMAAKCLLNIHNIQDLRAFIENPTGAGNIENNLSDFVASSLIRDISSATDTRFTPVRIIDTTDGKKCVDIQMSVPYLIESANVQHDESNNTQSKPNHLVIKCDGLVMTVEGETVSGNSTSTFTKEFTLPLGTNTKKITCQLNLSKHTIAISAPFVTRA